MKDKLKYIEQQFEWDDQKAQSNFEKHGVSFDFAASVFRDVNRIEWQDTRKDYGEVRLVTVGCPVTKICLSVVYTERKSVIRIISARVASKKERSSYYGYR